MKILLTNDDGIQSEITRALYESLKEKHEVTLIAPEKDKSGQGAAITLRPSVEVKKLDENLGNWICGEELSYADIYLFPTLVRWELIYRNLFKCR